MPDPPYNPIGSPVSCQIRSLAARFLISTRPKKRWGCFEYSPAVGRENRFSASQPVKSGVFSKNGCWTYVKRSRDEGPAEHQTSTSPFPSSYAAMCREKGAGMNPLLHTICEPRHFKGSQRGDRCLVGLSFERCEPSMLEDYVQSALLRD